MPVEGGRDQVHEDSRGGTEEESSMERTFSNQIQIQIQVHTGTGTDRDRDQLRLEVTSMLD